MLLVGADSVRCGFCPGAGSVVGRRYRWCGARRACSPLRASVRNPLGRQPLAVVTLAESMLR
eukprot:3649313-Pyramimonas_sp.AAC.1